MDCRRRSAVDDDRSRKIRLVVDDDRCRGRWAVDDDRSRIAFYQAQVKTSLDQVDKNLDRIDKNLRSIRRMRVPSATIPASSPSILSSAPRNRKQIRNQPAVIREYPLLELPLRWRDPPPDRTVCNHSAAVVRDSPSLKHTIYRSDLLARPVFRVADCSNSSRHLERITDCSDPSLHLEPVEQVCDPQSRIEFNLAVPIEKDGHSEPKEVADCSVEQVSDLQSDLEPEEAAAAAIVEPHSHDQISSCDPIPTPAPVRTALPPPLSPSRPPSLSLCDPMPDPAFEYTEPMLSVPYASPAAHGEVSMATLKSGSSASINQEKSENDDEDEGKDFRWSPDPGGTTLPICRVVAAALGGATIPSPSLFLVYLAGDSSSAKSCSSSTISTEKNDPTTQPALHAIRSIKCLTTVPSPPCSNQALENVREIVLYFLTSCSDRNAASLIGKSWFNAEAHTRLELFIGNCYAVSKEKEGKSIMAEYSEILSNGETKQVDEVAAIAEMNQCSQSNQGLRWF